MYKDNTFSIKIGITLIVTLLLVGFAEAKTITVDDGGGADYTRIQDAINAASNGDTITVYSGTYYENIDVNKQLILKGIDNGRGRPIVNAVGSTSAITLYAGGSTLEGFTFSNAINGKWVGYVAGIRVNSSNNTIRNNTATNNGVGILLYFSNNNTLIGNYANSNNGVGTYVGGVGIYLYTSDNNTLIDNTASFNKGDGILLAFSGNNTLNYNIVSRNEMGIYLHASSNNNSLIGNTATSNFVAILLYYSANYNILSNNTVSNNLMGVRLANFSNYNTLIGNTISNNKKVGISLSASSNNDIHNNIFNNINNLVITKAYNNFVTADPRNKWNISKTPGTNIIGGPYIGGNIWEHSDSTGISQTCTDSDDDGICDSPYTVGSDNSLSASGTGASGGESLFTIGSDNRVCYGTKSSYSCWDPLYTVGSDNIDYLPLIMPTALQKATPSQQSRGLPGFEITFTLSILFIIVIRMNLRNKRRDRI